MSRAAVGLGKGYGVGDYNLAGLNPRDFEHLIQALAMQVIAPGVVPYGDGPDGGREATYKGKMQYPSATDAWDGYLVLQAKFRVRPKGDPTQDGDWALDQLKQDLSKFADSERNLPKPDYYIFVTNVVLTPVQNTGSKDKVLALFEQYQAVLGLKGYDVWDFDKLCRLLDGQPEIYRRYAGFITAGDVLTKMMDLLQGLQPDFAQVMSVFLQNELRADQYVKLEQAGHSAEQKTALAQVFVDLPCSDRRLAEPPNDLNDIFPGVIAQLLHTGSRMLKGRDLLPSDEPMSTGGRKRVLEASRYVLVGGPGQGKSTIGQFLCQVYRAAILRDRPPHTIAAETREPLSLIEKQCEDNRLVLPGVRRFPIRIVLDQFATALVDAPSTSLLDYILQRINQRSNRSCRLDDLRHWLAGYPWLVVLDGLDEVPATSNRAEVLEKITDFWTEVSTLEADVLVVATTRPQGYSNDFSPHFYQHRYLVPLTTYRAEKYAERLTRVKYEADTDRQERVFNRLRMALENTDTRRLMRSPLQVTIMALLVDRIGQPPQERWRLFQDYYEVIYQRETERGIPASRILQQRKADVNAIHHRVGLVLQTESERAGNTESRLPAARFSALVRARVAEEGYEGADLEQRTAEITEAALNRLVFLVGLESDQIGFEVRSLQEFTAAEALLDGREEQVRARLEAIATSPHWRNVFLFAVGKCFAVQQSLRDMIMTICEQLNDPINDQLAGVTLAGSQLALEILEDGVVREQPRFARSLMRLALRLLELRKDTTTDRLVAVYDPGFEQLFREQISLHLRQQNFIHSCSAWMLLDKLFKRGVSWVEAVAQTHWPAAATQQIRVLEVANAFDLQLWVQDLFAELVPQLDPEIFRSRDWFEMIQPREGYPYPDWLIAACMLDEDEAFRDLLRIPMFSTPLREYSMELTTPPLCDPYTDSLAQFPLPLANPAWAPYIASARFARQPGATALAHELRWLSNVWSPDAISTRRYGAWPLAACIAASQSSDDLRMFADRAEQGLLGQVEDWYAAQQRWLAQGVTEDDILYLTNEHWPYDAQIRAVGFPLSCSQYGFHNGGDLQLWQSLWSLYTRLPSGKARSTLATQVLRLLPASRVRLLINIQPDQLKQLVLDRQQRWFRWELFRGIRLPEVLTAEWIEVFDWLGQQEYTVIGDPWHWQHTAQLAETYMRQPDRYGLLHTLATLAVSGNRVQLPQLLLSEKYLSADTARTAAALILTSQGDWDAAEVDALAQRLAHAPVSHNTIEYAIAVMNNGNLPHADKERLLLALREHLMMRREREFNLVVEALQSLMQSRPSRIGEPEYWAALKLPPVP